MDTGMDFNTPDFNGALRAYQEGTGKEWPDVVNRAGRSISFYAWKNTPALSKGRLNKHDPNRSPRRPGKLHYALAAKKGFTKGNGIGDEARKSYAKSKSSTGYMKLGWVAANRHLGEKSFGRRTKLSARLLREADAKRAKVNFLVAEVTNGVRLKDPQKLVEIGGAALAAAMPLAAADMRAFGEKKMRERALKHSAR